MFGERVASRLRKMRKQAGHRQQRVADALDLSVSAISRLERGIRGLRVEQLVDWAGCLGYNVEVVFYEPVSADDDAPELDGEANMILADVASALPYMPAPARMALAHEMQLWREAARSSASATTDPANRVQYRATGAPSLQG